MRAFPLACALACLGLLLPAGAQEGHPLSGTWTGDWGPTGTQRHHVTLVMQWDGKQVSGTLNPGPDAVPLASVFLDVTNWTVRIEADTKDQSGKPVHLAAQGQLKDIGSYHRQIAGTWHEGSAQGEFTLTRD